jgi:hypothetical protein
MYNEVIDDHCAADRERERDRDRDRDRQTETETETERQRQRQRQRESFVPIAEVVLSCTPTKVNNK